MKNLLFVLTIFICSFHCQGQKNISYQDSVYLIIKDDLSNLDSLAPNLWKNVDVYTKAHNRLIRHLYIKDNKLAWDIKSGVDIKISENIYQYITGCITYNNEKHLPSGDYEIRKNKEDGCYYVFPKKSPTETFRKVKQQNTKCPFKIVL